MSTRAAIAVPEGDGWKGRYHRFDGYPEGLGATLHKLYHSAFGEDLDRMVHVLTEEHTSWSVVDGDWSMAPGFVETIGGDRSNPQCYCHGDCAEPGDWITCTCPNSASECGALYIEYAYVLTERGFFIYCHGPSGETEEVNGYTTKRYMHLPVGFAPWNEPYDGDAWGAKAQAVIERQWSAVGDPLPA